MGDRISISFTDGQTESIALFNSYWGQELLETALKYLKEIKYVNDKHKSNPFTRKEARVIMLDFIRWLNVDFRKESFYLGKDFNDGDNSDNEHFKINIFTGEAEFLLTHAQINLYHNL